MPAITRPRPYPSKAGFKITEHKYVGGGTDAGGYLDLLEVHNPPEGKAPVFIHFWGTGWPHELWEFSSLEAALAAWGEHWPDQRKLHTNPGCTRHVTAPDLRQRPWYMARQPELLPEDFFRPQPQP